jgi:hypothetical protein
MAQFFCGNALISVGTNFAFHFTDSKKEESEMNASYTPPEENENCLESSARI